MSCQGEKGWHPPQVRSRLIFLIIISMFNTAFCLFFALNPKSYASNYLLYIFMGNMGLYLFYYKIMKMICDEMPPWHAWFYFVCSIIMALPSMYFFKHKEKTTDLSPAESRSLNRDCLLFNIYDGHDIWHFLGAGGIFFMYMFLLTIDEDLNHARRQLIRVF